MFPPAKTTTNSYRLLLDLLTAENSPSLLGTASNFLHFFTRVFLVKLHLKFESARRADEMDKMRKVRASYGSAV
jgi:hypothetical protein